MPYSAYCLFFVPPNKQLDPVLCSIGKWLIVKRRYNKFVLNGAQQAGGETGGLGPKDRSEEAQIRLKRSEWED